MRNIFGVSRQSVNRQLKSWKAEGLLVVDSERQQEINGYLSRRFSIQLSSYRGG
jgi:DNA-binding transcriptional regulator LsrR (DeoR family)